MYPYEESDTPTSEEFNTLCAASERHTAFRIAYNDRDGNGTLLPQVLYLTHDVLPNGFTIKKDAMGSEFCFGSTIAGELSFEIAVPNADTLLEEKGEAAAYLNKLTPGSKVSAESGFVLESGEEELIPMGTFYVDEIKRVNKNTISVHCLDAIGFLDQIPFSEVGDTVTWPATPYRITEAIINRTGLLIGRTHSDCNFSISKFDYENITCRQMVGWLAELTRAYVFVDYKNVIRMWRPKVYVNESFYANDYTSSVFRFVDDTVRWSYLADTPRQSVQHIRYTGNEQGSIGWRRGSTYPGDFVVDIDLPSNPLLEGMSAANRKTVVRLMADCYWAIDRIPGARWTSPAQPDGDATGEYLSCVLITRPEGGNGTPTAVEGDPTLRKASGEPDNMYNRDPYHECECELIADPRLQIGDMIGLWAENTTDWIQGFVRQEAFYTIFPILHYEYSTQGRMKVGCPPFPSKKQVAVFTETQAAVAQAVSLPAAASLPKAPAASSAKAVQSSVKPEPPAAGSPAFQMYTAAVNQADPTEPEPEGEAAAVLGRDMQDTASAEDACKTHLLETPLSTIQTNISNSGGIDAVEAPAASSGTALEEEPQTAGYVSREELAQILFNCIKGHSYRYFANLIDEYSDGSTFEDHKEK